MSEDGGPDKNEVEVLCLCGGREYLDLYDADAGVLEYRGECPNCHRTLEVYISARPKPKDKKS